MYRVKIVDGGNSGVAEGTRYTFSKRAFKRMIKQLMEWGCEEFEISKFSYLGEGVWLWTNDFEEEFWDEMEMC